MHQQPALGVDARFAVTVPPRAAAPDRADRLGLGPGEDEFGGVLDNEDRPGGRFNAARRGGEVARQDRVLAKAAIGKETVAAFVPAQSWQASGSGWPMASPSSPSSLRSRSTSRLSPRRQPAISASTHDNAPAVARQHPSDMMAPRLQRIRSTGQSRMAQRWQAPPVLRCG